MRKFILKVSLFLLLPLMLAFPIDFYFSSNLRKSHTSLGEIEVMNDIYKGNINADIAIYGSSRAWVQINPKIIEDSIGKAVYNFGIDGHNFWLQYMRHLEYFNHNKKPATIILSVDEFSLDKRIDLYQSNQFLPFMFWNKNIFEYTHSYEGYRLFDYFIPLVRFSGKIKSLKETVRIIVKGDNGVKYRYKGFAGVDKKWNGDEIKKFKRKNKNKKIVLDSKSVKLFEQFLKETEELNINVILIYTPEHIEGQGVITNRNEILNYYKNMSIKHNLLFLDFSKDEICLDKNLFYNALHLNKKGADIFTKKLVNKLKNEKAL